MSDQYVDVGVKHQSHLYPHVRAALDEFKFFVEHIPQRDATTPESPNKHPPVNTMAFKHIADAMQQLPTVAPQLLSAELRAAVRDLQKEYESLVHEAGSKLRLSTKDVSGIVRAVIPTAAGAAPLQESTVHAKAAHSSRRPAGSDVNFAFGNNAQQISAKNPNEHKSKPSFLGALFGSKRAVNSEQSTVLAAAKRARV